MSELTFAEWLLDVGAPCPVHPAPWHTPYIQVIQDSPDSWLARDHQMETCPMD